MKSLILLRHAESAEKTPGQTDRDRGLTTNGVKQCTSIADFMKEKELRPDEIIASDALRVKSTIDHIIKRLRVNPNVSYSRDLYEADVSGYMEVVRQASDGRAILIAGHNPGISRFASYISKTKVDEMGTGDLLVFHFKEGHWSTMSKGKCELMEHFAPKP